MWSLVAESFEKFVSCPAIKYFDSDEPASCLSLTFSELFQGSDVIRRELGVSNKKGPVALLFPDDDHTVVVAYPTIIAIIRYISILLLLTVAGHLLHF